MANEIPVYLFVGFLESGKTKFIQETFEDPNFDSGDKTLLLICEEGEEEYNPKKFSKADIEHALTELDTGNYGMILRSKGIVDGGADGWLEFDYVPGEWEVRQRGADVGGKLVVIGSKLDEHAIATLFGC